MRIVVLACLLAFTAGCSDSEPDAATKTEATSSPAVEEVFQDVTGRGVDISRGDFDLVTEAVCDRDMPDVQTESREWNRVADTIGELGGIDSFLDARLLVRSIDRDICTSSR